jgi:asparagine synthase (glutamine-hydrolysing)
MANFVAVVDQDRQRREQFMRIVEPLTAPMTGLTNGSCSSGDCSVAWSANARAPISQNVGSQGAAVVMGDAFRRGESKRLSAADLQQWWSDCPSRLPETLDGYHVGLFYKASGELIVGADLLGMFPIYYYAAEGVVLVGSSPELFRHHPLFRTSFNADALTAMLLMMYPIDGDTLFRSVHRLDAGHLLVVPRNQAPTEVLQYDIPLSEEYFTLPFSKQVRLLDHAMEQAVARHVPTGRRCTLLLSGGRDSRLLAGYLHRLKYDAAALTLGNSAGEFELNFGRAVARALGFSHESRAVNLEEYPRYAELHARWLQGNGGFDPIMYWGFDAQLRAMPSPVVTGYVGDPIIGGSALKASFDAVKGRHSFGAYFKDLNRHGFAPERVSRLLSPRLFGGTVERVLTRIERAFGGLGKDDAQRVYRFALRHRMRLYVGSVVWQASFGAWPVQPYVDQELLQVVGGMPISTLAERRAQDALLCTYFPDLAALPLDRNSFDTTPLQPRIRWLLGQFFAERVPLWEQWTRRRESSEGERRMYYSLWNINGTGWKAIRREADQYRHLAHEFFDADELAKLLPPADDTLQAEDMIAGHSGVRSLLGFLLWAKDHLSLVRQS